MTNLDVHGPIDFLILEFPQGAGGESTATALMELVDRGTVRLYDVMVVRKEADGKCHEVDINALDVLPAVKRLAGARSGLLGTDDVDEAAGALEPDTIGLVLVYENAWAVPFVAAARGDGGQLVATSRLTAQEIMDALDSLEAAV
jgi:hypothetical protein